ncbi:unnamed protein product [Didymodactylos carnosus]|uniref:Uncharacterized protein n=1 Tax=Didymodactylos carnosus TaxID=1234261 RepID=A0A815VBB1_9BILA|nr:unnamed protein product [Didymodactylos carnosus]CAF1528252.1 unnamed protein product [Didymodactylos carnosus]CAF4120827.1 unnamed protein product [Didymodactylos carnosus]CAF4387394.1 unnamed protein product [Didymodactylos carnosus]
MNQSIFLCVLWLNLWLTSVAQSESKTSSQCNGKNNDGILIKNFDDQVPLKYLNCTGNVNTKIIKISFEISTTKSVDQLLTLYTGPCSGSNAYLYTGQMISSTYGTLNNEKEAYLSSVKLSKSAPVTGTIMYEDAYGTSKLTLALINISTRKYDDKSDEMVTGTYELKYVNISYA